MLEQYGPKFCVGSVQGVKAVVNDGIIPYSQSSYWCGWNSAYYKDSHRKFQTAVRQLVKDILAPIAMKIEKKGIDPPPEVKT